MKPRAARPTKAKSSTRPTSGCTTTGPEFEGWLSNHGPMAADALIRIGCGEEVERWVGGYARRLHQAPGPRWEIEEDEWREVLGDPSRLGDWTALFERLLREEPWRDVLVRWWPRLIDGAIASATHGLIRTGHAVRALLETPTAPRRAELAHALGYWAARHQRLPVHPRPVGAADAALPWTLCPPSRPAAGSAPAWTTSPGPRPGRRPWPASTHPSGSRGACCPRCPGRRCRHPLPALGARQAGHAGARRDRTPSGRPRAAGPTSSPVGPDLRGVVGRCRSHQHHLPALDPAAPAHEERATHPHPRAGSRARRGQRRRARHQVRRGRSRVAIAAATLMPCPRAPAPST